MTSSKKHPTCPTCGKPTTAKGHLCSPRTPDGGYKCETNDAPINDPSYKNPDAAYICATCQRTSDDKEDLCIPQKNT